MVNSHTPHLAEIVRGLVSIEPAQEFVGDVRLQRTVYFLDRLGYDSGLSDWRYSRHGGPHSEDLADAVGHAELFGAISHEVRRRPTDGVGYRVFHPRGADPIPETVWGTLGLPRIRTVVELLHATPATIVDLAAVVDWCATIQGKANWVEEIKIRRGVQATRKNLEAALDLLGRLQMVVPKGPIPEDAPKGPGLFGTNVDLADRAQAVGFARGILLGKILEIDRPEEGVRILAVVDLRQMGCQIQEDLGTWAALEALDEVRPGAGRPHLDALRARVKAEVAQLTAAPLARSEPEPAF